MTKNLTIIYGNPTKNLIKKKLTEMHANRSIDINIANKGGKACKDFWKVLRGNANCGKDAHCIKSLQSDEVIYDKDKMNQSTVQHWSTLGKMHMP